MASQTTACDLIKVGNVTHERVRISEREYQRDDNL